MEKEKGKKEIMKEFIDRYLDLLKDTETFVRLPPEALTEYAPYIEKVVGRAIALSEIIDKHPEVYDEFLALGEHPKCAEIIQKKIPERGKIPQKVLRDIYHECIEAVYQE